MLMISKLLCRQCFEFAAQTGAMALKSREGGGLRSPSSSLSWLQSAVHTAILRVLMWALLARICWPGLRGSLLWGAQTYPHRPHSCKLFHTGIPPCLAEPYWSKQTNQPILWVRFSAAVNQHISIELNRASPVYSSRESGLFLDLEPLKSPECFVRHVDLEQPKHTYH